MTVHFRPTMKLSSQPSLTAPQQQIPISTPSKIMSQSFRVSGEMARSLIFSQGGAAINQKQPVTVMVVSKKTPKPTVRIQDPPIMGNEIQETMMNSPVWNKYVGHFSNIIVCLPCLLLVDVNPNSMSRTRGN
jgi:hypothetical protein